METTRNHRRRNGAAVLFLLLLAYCADEAIDMPIWPAAPWSGAVSAATPAAAVTARQGTPGRTAPGGRAHLVRTAAAPSAGAPALAGQPMDPAGTPGSVTPDSSADAYELVPFDLSINGAPAGVVVARVTASGTYLVSVDDVRRATGSYLEGAPAWMSTAEIGERLGATVDVDLARLTIRITRRAAFPAEIARRRAAYPTRTAAAPEPPDVGLATGGALLEWDALMQDTDAEQASVRARLSGLVLGGHASITYADVPLASYGRARFGLGWARRFASPWLTELQAGNVQGTPLQPLPLFGVRASNVPANRRGMLVPVGDGIPAGWSYDVLSGGYYLGGAEGGRLVDVALPYGTSSVEVRAYGPGGESAIRRMALVLLPGQLPAGAVEYTATAGRCAMPGCSTPAAAADASWGATNWLTVGGAAAWSERYGSTLGASASLAGLEGWQLRAEGTTDGALRFAGIRTAASSGLSVAGGRRADRVPGAPWYGELTSSFNTAATSAWLPTSLSLSGYAQTGGGGYGRITAAASWRRGYGEGTYSILPHHLGADTQARIGVLLPASLPALLRDQPLTLDVRRDGGGILDAGAVVQLRIREREVVNLGPRWDRRNGWGLYLTLASYGTPTDLRTQMRTGRHGTEAWSTAAGALAYAPGAGLLQVRRGSTYAGGVSGRVFYDLDGDGRFSRGDSAATGVRVLVGYSGDATDASGVYAAWDLRPYEAVTVRIDSTALRDPRWVALTPEISVVPVPSMFRTADFALVQTVEVAGALVAGEMVGTSAGVGLTLRNLATGETSRVRTFADGTYYLPRLAPGRYELAVDPVALQLLMASADPAPLVFTAPADGPGFLELPSIRLTRLRTTR